MPLRLSNMPPRARLLIDTDPGIDDALALLLAFASPGISVEAVTTVAGNVSVDLATDNLLRILGVVRPDPLPRIARGADTPLARPLEHAAHVHGDDGLGHVDRLVEPDGRPRYPLAPHALETLDGADLILETAERLGPELTVVALGPLTNLALALSRGARTLARVARVVVMGGAVREAGNVTPAAEFNFHVDPEAAAAVFDAGLPLELVPLDVTRQVLLRPSHLARLGADTPVTRFVSDFTRHGFAFADEWGDGGMAMHDPLAVGVALDPGLVTFEPLHLEVECGGRHTRGMVVADRRPIRPHRKRPANARVAVAVDGPRFLDLLVDRLCPASR